MSPIEDPDLQAIADTKEGVEEAADLSYELDVADCDDDVGAHVSGFTDGLLMAEKVLKLRSTDNTIEIFRIAFDDYGDGDGVAFFFGTKEQVRYRLEALDAADKNDDNDKEEDDDESDV